MIKSPIHREEQELLICNNQNQLQVFLFCLKTLFVILDDGFHDCILSQILSTYPPKEFLLPKPGVLPFGILASSLLKCFKTPV